jgi:hypothetical protein
MVLFMLLYVLFITILCINNHIEYKNKCRTGTMAETTMDEMVLWTKRPLPGGILNL